MFDPFCNVLLSVFFSNHVDEEKKTGCFSECVLLLSNGSLCSGLILTIQFVGLCSVVWHLLIRLTCFFNKALQCINRRIQSGREQGVWTISYGKSQVAKDLIRKISTDPFDGGSYGRL